MVYDSSAVACGRVHPRVFCRMPFVWDVLCGLQCSLLTFFWGMVRSQLPVPLTVNSVGFIGSNGSNNVSNNCHNDGNNNHTKHHEVLSIWRRQKPRLVSLNPERPKTCIHHLFTLKRCRPYPYILNSEPQTLVSGPGSLGTALTPASASNSRPSELVARRPAQILG